MTAFRDVVIVEAQSENSQLERSTKSTKENEKALHSRKAFGRRRLP